MVLTFSLLSLRSQAELKPLKRLVVLLYPRSNLTIISLY